MYTKKTRTFEIFSEVITTVTSGHQLYTKDEVSYLLRSLQGSIDALPNEEAVDLERLKHELVSNLKITLEDAVNDYDFESTITLELSHNNTIEASVDADDLFTHLFMEVKNTINDSIA